MSIIDISKSEKVIALISIPGIPTQHQIPYDSMEEADAAIAVALENKSLVHTFPNKGMLILQFDAVCIQIVPAALYESAMRQAQLAAGVHSGAPIMRQ